jgi:hypothetical protein
MKEVLLTGKTVAGLIDAKSNDTFMTALHMTALQGNLTLVRELLDNQANPHIGDKYGKTALHLAVQRGHTEVVRALVDAENGGLLSATADASGGGQNGGSSTPQSLRRRRRSSATTMFARDAASASPSSRGGSSGDGLFAGVAKLTPLQTAAAYGHDGIVRLLLESGASCSTRNSSGETALHLAAKYNHCAAAAVLLDADSRLINAPMKGLGNTPLHYACMGGHLDVALLLVERGADAHQPNTTAMRRTPLDTAQDCGHSPVFNAVLGSDRARRRREEELAGKKELAAQGNHQRTLQEMQRLGRRSSTLRKELKEKETMQRLLEEDRVIRQRRVIEAQSARERALARTKSKKGGIP